MSGPPRQDLDSFRIRRDLGGIANLQRLHRTAGIHHPRRSPKRRWQQLNRRAPNSALVAYHGPCNLSSSREQNQGAWQKRFAQQQSSFVLPEDTDDAGHTAGDSTHHCGYHQKCTQWIGEESTAAVGRHTSLNRPPESPTISFQGDLSPPDPLGKGQLDVAYAEDRSAF